MGLEPLLKKIEEMLQKIGREPVIFEKEFSWLDAVEPELPFEVTYDAKEKEYVAEGPLIEKMLGYTNLESEKGFIFFQKFLKDRGVIDALKEAGMQEGDTVRLYGHVFEYLEDEV